MSQTQKCSWERLCSDSRPSSTQQRLHASEVLLLYVLPFAYGAATRVPFVFASLHCITVLQCSMHGVSLTLGCYQVSRILGNYTVKLLGPHRSLPTGATAGLFGYTLIAATERANLIPASLPGRSAAHLLLTAALALVGLSEQITALQDICKARYQLCGVTSRRKLLKLYACNVCGTCVAFFLSGVCYHYHGLFGAACLGAALEFVLLSGSLGYLGQQQVACVMSPVGYRSSNSRTAQQAALAHCDDTTQLPAAEYHSLAAATTAAAQSSCALQAQCKVVDTLIDSQNRYQTRCTCTIQHGGVALQQELQQQQQQQQPRQLRALGCPEPSSLLQDTTEQLQDGNDPPTWISYSISITFCVQAVLIGTVLSTAPLLLSSVLGLGVLHVGLAFSAGEGLGSVTLQHLATPAGQALVHRILPMPLCMLAVLLTMAVTAVCFPLFTSPWSALCCVVVLMWLNDVGTSMCGECQGAMQPARHYRTMNLLGNMLRRLGNTVTCTLGPILFQHSPAAPFVVSGMLLLTWVGLLTAMFALRARQLEHPEAVPATRAKSVLLFLARGCKVCNNTAGKGSPSMHEERPGLLHDLLHYKQVSFISGEQQYWQVRDVGLNWAAVAGNGKKSM